MEAAREALAIVLTFGIPIFGCWLVVWTIKITGEEKDKRRREQHSEYFEYFDTAMAISNNINEFTEQQTASFEYRLKLIYEGLRDGECTVDYFQEYLAKINKEYIAFATWFEEQNKEAKRLFREADLYAKLRDLKWGYLY